jgi:hypothetical protein
MKVIIEDGYYTHQETAYRNLNSALSKRAIQMSLVLSAFCWAAIVREP